MLRLAFVVGALLCATLALTFPSHAFPSTMNGKWTTKKGNCQTEYVVNITPKTFNRYEEYCKIDRVQEVDFYGTKDYKFDLSCNAEGEKVKTQLEIKGQETNDQLKVYEKGVDGIQWLFRCKK